MDTDTVIELMRSAPRRYKTVRAALRYRGDGPAIKDARKRYRASELGRLEARVEPGAPPQGSHPEPDGLFGWRCRVWYARGNPRTNGGRYRVELELPREVHPAGGTHVYAWDGARAFLDRRIGGGPAEDDPGWLLVARVPSGRRTRSTRTASPGCPSSCTPWT